jgi:FkbM family methyltransferase
MSELWAREVCYHPPFTAGEAPFLARYHRFAFQRAASRKADLFLYVPLRRLFVLYRRLCRKPCWGVFEYQRLGSKRSVRCDVRNLQFQVHFSRTYERGYEAEVALLQDALLPEGGTFYDIGSNWGYFALYAASRRTRLIVHAFEPHPQTFHDLAGCVEQAGLKELVTCHNFALSSADGEAFIRIPDRLHSGQAEVSRSGRTRISTRRLDALDLPPPDFIKMDVEGHEIEVLQGAESTLRRIQPFVVFENKRDYAAPGRTLEPLFFLASLGYRFFQAAVQRHHAVNSFLLPCGYGPGQPVGQKDVLVLAPFSAAERFLFQDDLNVLACHEDKLEALRAAFPKSS